MFTIWPTAQALYLSFTNATSLGLNNKFVGLDNYIYMFHDKSFIQALKNTAKLMAVVPVITIFCSLVLAFVLNQCKLKEMVLYRTLFYFPNIVSLTVVGIIWSFVFHPNVGIVNKILGAVGLESLQRSWLGDSKTALWCIAFTLLWQAAGYYMVMHIAAMDGISPEIYESATLDGASAWRKLYQFCIGKFFIELFLRAATQPQSGNVHGNAQVLHRSPKKRTEYAVSQSNCFIPAGYWAG